MGGIKCHTVMMLEMAAIRILSKRIFVMNDPHYCSIALRMRIVHR